MVQTQWDCLCLVNYESMNLLQIAFKRTTGMQVSIVRNTRHAFKQKTFFCNCDLLFIAMHTPPTTPKSESNKIPENHHPFCMNRAPYTFLLQPLLSKLCPFLIISDWRLHGITSKASISWSVSSFFQ